MIIRCVQNSWALGESWSFDAVKRWVWNTPSGCFGTYLAWNASYSWYSELASKYYRFQKWHVVGASTQLAVYSTRNYILHRAGYEPTYSNVAVPMYPFQNGMRNISRSQDYYNRQYITALLCCRLIKIWTELKKVEIENKKEMKIKII